MAAVDVVEMDALREFLRGQLDLSDEQQQGQDDADSSSLNATQLAAQLVQRFRELRVQAEDQKALINEMKEKRLREEQIVKTAVARSSSMVKGVAGTKVLGFKWSKVSEIVGIYDSIKVGDENTCVSTPPIINGSPPGGQHNLAALLRAKDAVIDRLNRRIKVLESKAGLESTVQHLAHREAMFERERNRLRKENEKLRLENEQINQQLLISPTLAAAATTTEEPIAAAAGGGAPKAAVCGKKTRLDDLYAYLQRTVIRYLLLSSQRDSRNHQQEEEIGSLMPILCALSNATEAEAKTILRSCQLPSPRHYT